MDLLESKQEALKIMGHMFPDPMQAQHPKFGLICPKCSGRVHVIAGLTSAG